MVPLGTSARTSHARTQSSFPRQTGLETRHTRQRVDENLDDSLTNVREGYSQLQRYWRNLSSSRGLMMRVFAVLLFFIVVWGTLFA